MNAVPQGRKRFRRWGVGEQRGGPVTYLVLIVTMAIAIFPLYWTWVAASRTNP